MNVEVAPGTYVIAVSGGVDSVVLLAILSAQPNLHLTVAHFDHGIRADSAEDAAFVETLATKYGLPFKTERAELGPSASEATARQARYDFLRRVRQQTGALAIITAHHQDDVLETAIFNILRGTGRRGLTSLKSTAEIARPLLDVPKSVITTYALKHGLSWREDSTNYDERYRRNYIRHRLLVRFDTDARQQLLALITRLRHLNDELDQELASYYGETIDRQRFSALPTDIAQEVMAGWLRAHQLGGFDRPMIERLTGQCQTKPVGKRFDAGSGRQITLTKHCLALSPIER